MKYEQESQAIIEAIGGRENLANAFHCMTRLRLEVKDPAKVDVDALGKVNKVLKVVQVGQQFQCVFGPQVSDVYKDFCEVAGLEQQAMVDEDADGAPAEKEPRDLSPKGILDTVIDY
ncbi:MAG: PTS glucose/sucrose transporter subunit IIB, partial [Atopobiaceae bacterium]|nr:PTS glucose/sucrose transporter subunit IIB [Atopobiaceae bacterium]